MKCEKEYELLQKKCNDLRNENKDSQDENEELRDKVKGLGGSVD